MPYSGMIIGGYHDGETHVINEPILRLPVLNDVSECVPLDVQEIPTTFETGHVELFKHHVFQFRNSETREQWKFEFWVPVEVKSPQPFIMEKLIEGYKP